ncbi:hypothetical protein Bca101_090477 [Brassica carinata]
MNRLMRNRGKDETSRLMRRRIQEEEEEIIREETYQRVGKTLGIFEKADVEGGRVRICINGDQPLKFECKVGFDNGDVVKVKIQYEDLYRHCFTCKRISHEEGTCPELTDGQKERKRVARIDQMEEEERANREAFSTPQRIRLESQRRVSPETKRGRESYYKDDTSNRAWRRTPSGEKRDLRNKLTEKRVTHSKNVWNRLDSVTPTQYPRANDRYHPYYQNSGGVGQRDKTRDTASSSEWRRKDLNKNSERNSDLFRKNPSRSRVSPDSQRTISEHSRPPSYRGNYGGRKSRSPPKYRTEWRPVSNPRSGGNMISTSNSKDQEDRDRTSARTCSDQVTGRDGGISTETRLQILQRSAENQLYLQKDKNQGETSDLAEPAKATNPFSNDNNSILLGEKEKAQGETPRQNALHHMDKEIVPFKETEGEQELANPIDDLTEGEMEEEMLENDDLLDEDFEIRTGEADETFEEGEIKALSHLLPDKAGRQQSPAHAPRPTRTKAEQTKDKKVAKGSKDDKAVRGALGSPKPKQKCDRNLLTTPWLQFGEMDLGICHDREVRNGVTQRR